MPNEHDHGYGTLGNPGNAIANRLAALDDSAVSANFFSGLLGMNPSTVSQMLQGKKEIPSEVMSLMVSLLKDLGALIEKIRPFHLDFRPARADEYRSLLRKIRDSEMFINIWQVADTPESRERQRMELHAAIDALGTARESEPPSNPEPKIVAQPVEPKAPPVSNHRPSVGNFG